MCKFIHRLPPAICCLVVCCFIASNASSQNLSSKKILWQIGNDDHSAAEFALAPSGYGDFLENDFGWEDGYFLIGKSDAKKDWPYALPGPEDSWGGSAHLAGWHAAELNILFGIDHLFAKSQYTLVVNILDMSAEKPPLLKISINGKPWKFALPKGSGDSTLKEPTSKKDSYIIKIPVPNGLLQKGGNEISLTSLWGSWLVFDQVRMESNTDVQLIDPRNVFIRKVSPANYETTYEGKSVQPLLVDIEHVSGTPVLDVVVDGNLVLHDTIEQGRYVLEAPMPEVKSTKESAYEIIIDGKILQSGLIKRSPQKLIKLAGYVDTKIGSAHSRWMIAPGPWMPFSMVKISPDNQNSGWQSGYDPIFESIGGFSHIHEWTMSGLSMMPVNGPLITDVGDQAQSKEGYRSAIDKQTEEAPLGYYKARLTKYNITAELTATTRCSFQRYTFPIEKVSRILIDFKSPAEYDYELEDVEVTKVGDYRIEGISKQRSPEVWGKGIDQDYVIHFVMEFDQPINQIGFWDDKGVAKNVSQIKIQNNKKAGVYLEFNTTLHPTVQIRTGLSFVSIKNAGENLQKEVIKPFGWNFNAVRKNNVDTWNDLFKRVKISSPDHREKVRFYTNMYRALCSRGTFSDVNGEWMDATNKLQQLTGKDELALGCDAFWNTFWNLNQFWNLVTPEWSSRWVKSQLAMYDANGWLAKGPGGMKYIPVMVAEHEIPLIVGAY
ncbi:MAG: glycoside hydrolase domain-containing protein, partial [Ginsengibacter sp.]